MSGLPLGFAVAIGTDVWRTGDGRTFVGGAPMRVMRVSARGMALFDDDLLTVRDDETAALAERLLHAGIAHPVLTRLPTVPLEALTVVVPSLGRAERVERLLASLPDVPVVVVDDGTRWPDSLDLAAVARHHGGRVVRLDQNRGPAAARNAGLATVTTDFVAFIDSDVVVPPGALEELLKHFHDGALGLIGPRIGGLPTPQDSWISRYEHARSSLDLSTDAALVRPRSPVSWISSTCLIARREAIGTGFSEGLRVGEDVDLVWRIAGTPWRVRYEPGVVVLHEHRSRIVPWIRRKVFYGTGGADLADRHPLHIAPAILRPWSTTLLICAMIARPWSVIVAAGATVYAAQLIHSSLPTSSRSRALSLRLTASGVLAALTQGSALLLRHWWPLAALAALVSLRARRVVLVAGIADALIEYIRLRPRLDPVRFAIARRLDDLAYGTGLWLGALRRRSPRALLPEVMPVRAARDHATHTRNGA